MLQPLALSQAPIKIDIGESHYSSETQSRVYASHIEPLTFTMNGTQTYRYDGRPSDSDND